MWLDAKYLNPFFTRRLTQEVSESGGKSFVWHLKKRSQSFVNTLLFSSCHALSSVIGIYPQLIYISHYHDVFIHCERRFDLDENLCRQEMCKDACMNISAQGFIPIFIFIVFWGGVHVM